MNVPSYVGESAAVIAVLDFIYWASLKTPSWTLYVWILFAALFITDWMLGGIADKGLCRKCFSSDYIQ